MIGDKRNEYSPQSCHSGLPGCCNWHDCMEALGLFRMPFKEFTRYALYMAVMDDEICRNELEGNDLGGVRIEFPDKMDSLQMAVSPLSADEPKEKPPANPG